ncbi:MAG: EamA family transporter [Mailhella sp.]|nr:EamA family transporter [Mailhella sp.]
MLTQRGKTYACLFLVCASWGSCYLFIELALRSFPPYALTSMRIGLAGVILYALLWLRGARQVPTLSDLRRAFVMGFFMSFLSAGLMTVGQKYVPSGTVAIIMGSTPLWMVIAAWLLLHESPPSRRQCLGLLLGTASVILLGIRQGSLGMGSAFGMVCLALNIAGWVGGSLYAKLHAHDTQLTVHQTSALMLMAGGLELCLTSLVLGEQVNFCSLPALAWISLLILIFFGGITAYSCYFWLLEHTSTAVAISYDYVNPAIGMLLGRLVTNEPLDALKVGICFSIIAALYLVVTGGRKI